MKEVYRGKNKKCSVNGLEKNTEYNVRVKCVVGELQGMWSSVTKFKTKNFQVRINSAIFSSEANKEAFEEKLSEWSGIENFELLYRGSGDGFGVSNFHRLCDNKGKTLILVRNTSGHLFGGFASISWESSGGWKQAPGSFLFTLTNMYGIQPTKFPLIDKNNGNAVHHNNNWGPAFGSGCTLYVSSDCNANTSSHANGFGTENTIYDDTTKKGGSIFSSNSSTNNFQVQDYEVFRVG